MPGLLRGGARTAVVAGTATAVSNRVSRRQANRWASQDQQSYEEQAYQQQQQQAYAAPPPAPAPADDMDAKLAQLKELGELKSQGVLSEEEFAAQKQRILGSSPSSSGDDRAREPDRSRDGFGESTPGHPALDGHVRAGRRHVADERVDLGGGPGPRHHG